MKNKLLIIALTFCAIVVMTARSQSLLFHTLAGQTTAGNSDGSVNDATFSAPIGVAVDAVGNVYVADTQNGTIRKIGTNNVVSTFAGSAGGFGALDATGTNAQFLGPQGIVADANGVLFVADTGNATIRKIASDGVVSTIAGSAGNANSFDGVGTNANFFQPEGIAIDNSGNLYVSDAWNHTIRKITPENVVTTIAGLAGYPGGLDGTNSKARFNRPAGIAVDAATNLFVADSLNHTIRKIATDGKVTTIAGLAGVWGNADGTNSAARFFQPQGIIADNSGNLFVIDSGNHTLRKLSPSGTNWIVSTVAGSSGNAGNVDGTGTALQFYFPIGIAKNQAGYFYVADSGNNAIRAEGFELSSFSTLPDGRVHFTLNGKSAVQYLIEGSSDLAIWSTVTNFSSPDGILNFTEPSTALSVRFYRARVGP